MVKLLVFDFDGTALGGYEPYDRFPDKFSDFLDCISEKGIFWATATTWHPQMQDRVFKRSKLRSRPVRAVGRTCFSCGIYIGNKMYLDAKWDIEMLIKKVNFERKYVRQIRDFLSSVKEIEFTELFDFIFDCNIRVSKRKILSILNSNRIMKNKTYNLFYNSEHFQIFPYYLSKDNGIKKIQKLLKITSEETVVAGDGINDIHIFDKKIAKFQIVPSNAHPEVKKAVKKNGGVVAKRRYSDGVIEGFKKLFHFC